MKNLIAFGSGVFEGEGDRLVMFHSLTLFKRFTLTWKRLIK